jgi:hypothetical protein
MNNTPEYWARMDLDYSNKMKEIYNENFTGELKEKFDEFTNNMMTTQAIIKSDNLMDILKAFQVKNNKLVKDNQMSFNRLSDNAFNYRPHLSCIVM